MLELVPPPCDPLARLTAAVDALVELATESGSSSMDVDLVHGLARQIDRLDGVRLAHLGSIDRSGVWALDGSRTARAWLARTNGCSVARASRDLRLARVLREHLPATHGAVLAGECSVEHASVLANHACDSDLRRDALSGPDGGERLLLGHTGLGVGDFTIATRRWAARVDPDAEDAKARAARDNFEVYLASTLGGGDLAGRMTPEATETLRTALKAMVGIPAADDCRTPGQRTHDALAALAALALSGGTLGSSNTIRPAVVVHVKAETLLEQEAKAAARSLLTMSEPAWWQSNGQPIPRSVFDKISCDSTVTRIVFGPSSEVLDVGREQRTFTRAQRRALDARDGRCRRPGCTAPPQLCQGHHLVHWSRGGVTSVANGLLLCWACHDWVHSRSIDITLNSDGSMTFTGPDGRSYGTSHPRAGPPPWRT